MSRWFSIAVVLFGTHVSAQEVLGTPKPNTGKLIYESWMTASFDGVRAGYFHDTVREIEVAPNQKVLTASRQLVLTVRRFGDVATIQAQTGTDESADGKVVGTFMSQQNSKNSQTVVRGVVEGNQLHTKAEGQMKFDKRIAWDPAVVGMWGELRMVGKLKPAPGTSFDYLMYEPTVNSIVKVNGKAEAIEEVQIGQQSYRLLRVTAQPMEIGGVNLPGSTFWYDNKYDLIKSETIMPGLGRLVMERASQEVAKQPCTGPDLGWRQSIKLNQALVSAHDAVAITFRVKLTDKNPIEVFARDERQSVRLVEAGVIELVVKAQRQPPTVINAAAVQPGPEFLQSNYFLTSDDPTVRHHATAAVGAETDAWKKAQLIESWVNQNMKALNFTEAMAPASDVARTMSGDCTEYSMLTAAMCRAAGVPSRPALGLVYVQGRDARPPMLAMHMWTEVWVNGQWMGLDATLGRGSIGPAHIKITDHSWHGVATMTPLLPLMRLNMAAPTVEIVNEQRSAP